MIIADICNLCKNIFIPENNEQMKFQVCSNCIIDFLVLKETKKICSMGESIWI